MPSTAISLEYLDGAAGAAVGKKKKVSSNLLSWIHPRQSNNGLIARICYYNRPETAGFLDLRNGKAGFYFYFTQLLRLVSASVCGGPHPDGTAHKATLEAADRQTIRWSHELSFFGLAAHGSTHAKPHQNEDANSYSDA